MSKTILVSALMAAVLLGVPIVASADSGHGHEKEKQSKADHHGGAKGHASAAMKMMSPAEAWAELKAARDAIASDIEEGALGDIHEKSEPLPELAVEMLEQSGDLDKKSRATIEWAVERVPSVSDALHSAADGEDVARTRKELVELDRLLKMIRTEFPDGALDAETHEMSDHGDHSAAPASGH